MMLNMTRIQEALTGCAITTEEVGSVSVVACCEEAPQAQSPRTTALQHPHAPRHSSTKSPLDRLERAVRK